MTPIISSFTGDTMSKFTPAVRKLRNGKVVKSNVKYPKGPLPKAGGPFTGMSIAKAYNCPTDLVGNAIAIVEYGGGWQQSDVNQSAQLQGCPVPVIHDVNAGLGNSPGSDADDEVALDIQAAMGVISYMAGQPAVIYMIWANSQQASLDAIGQLIDSGVKIGAVSVSWGSDEGDGQEQADSAGIQAFTQKYGIPYCCATGDNDDGAASTVDEPADSPYAVGVSGTTKTATSETVWNSGNGEGTGGGESNIFPMPAYQKGIIPPPASGNWRTTGDVAAIGDPATGLQVVLYGQVSPIGGTSLATPVFAAIICGMGLGKMAWPDCLYAANTAFRVVQGGNNNPSGSGNWPGAVCCGLGVPDGTALYEALTGGTAPPVPPTPVPPTPPAGNTVTGTTSGYTGTIQVPVGILGRTETVQFTVPPGTCTVTLPTSTMHPDSMTIQQILQLISQITAAISQILANMPQRQ